MVGLLPAFMLRTSLGSMVWWGVVPPWTPVVDKCCLSVRGGRMATCYERVQRCADPGGVSFVIISASPGADCVVVARELDLLTCPALYRHLVEQLDFGACRVLVIDFSRVGFLGAAGLGVLVEVRDRAELCGVELRLVVCSGPVWRPLRLTGLVGEFVIYENLAQALMGAPSGLQRAGGSSR